MSQVTNWRVLSITTEVLFGANIEDASQLDYRIYYCTYGVGGGDYKRLVFTKNKPKIQLKKEKGQPTIASFSFALPSTLANNLGAEIVVMCRMSFTGNQFFPMEENGQPRFIAAKLKHFLNTQYSDTIRRDKFKTLVVNTEQSILAGKK